LPVILNIALLLTLFTGKFVKTPAHGQ